MNDAAFKPEQTSIWSEGLPQQANVPPDQNQLVSCDEKIDKLSEKQNRLQFEADCLALARDASQLARLFNEETKTERAWRMAKVAHLRQENQIGSNLVMKHMNHACQHFCGSTADLQVELAKAYGLVVNFKKKMTSKSG